MNHLLNVLANFLVDWLNEPWMRVILVFNIVAGITLWVLKILERRAYWKAWRAGQEFEKVKHNPLNNPYN